MRVAVFAASSMGSHEAFAVCAHDLGTLLGQAGHTLVYGGGGAGLMGVLARACKAAGGRVEGVLLPRFIGTEHAWDGCDETIVTPDLRTRKQVLDARGEALIALPGGIGTLDEVVEHLALHGLNASRKRVVCINTCGCWRPLAELLRGMVDHGLARERVLDALVLVDDPAAAVRAVVAQQS